MNKLINEVSEAESEEKKGNLIEALKAYHFAFRKSPSQIIKDKIQILSKQLKINNSQQISKDSFKDRNEASKLLKLFHNKDYKSLQKIIKNLLKVYKNSAFLIFISAMCSIKTKKLTKAEKLLSRLISTNPYHFDFNFNLASIYLEEGNYKKSLNFYENAYVINPENPEVNYYLSICNKKIGRFELALYFSNHSIKYNNTNLDYFNNKLDILIELNKIREAEECIKINLLNQKNDKNLLCQIARIHNLNGNAKNALEILKTCIETYPDYDYAYYNLAFTYSASGEQDNAQKALEKCIEINPKNHSAHLAYSRIKKYKNNDKHLEVLKELYTNSIDDSLAKINISFAIAKAYEDIAEYKLAFHYLKVGNSIKNQIVNYDTNSLGMFVKKIKYHNIQIQNCSVSKQILKNNFTPIFLINMPRSGSSLIEQILSSHSKIVQGGELDYLHHFGSNLIINSETITKDAILLFRKKYLEALKNLERPNKIHGSFEYITDKMPNLFFYMGLIVSALPEAKIIHIRRQPEAVCWSNYKHLYFGNNQSFSYDIENIVDYYNHYLSLMEFWEERYSNIINVEYESLVSDPINQIKSIFDQLDINFEKQTLSHEKNSNMILTSSMHQVRKKIYNGSSEKWKNFSNFLDKPFRKLLY